MYIGRTPETELSKRFTQQYSGDDSTQSFTLPSPVDNAADLDVYVNNVHQDPFSSYTVTSANSGLNFADAPQTGTNNILVVVRDKQKVAGVIVDGLSVGESQLQSTTATAGQYGGTANLVVHTINVTGKGRVNNVANIAVKDLDFSGLPTGGGSVEPGRLYKESNNFIFIKT